MTIKELMDTLHKEGSRVIFKDYLGEYMSVGYSRGWHIDEQNFGMTDISTGIAKKMLTMYKDKIKCITEEDK